MEKRINDHNNVIPDNTIAIITDHDDFKDTVFDIIEPLKGKNERDWFVKHAYFCLPLVIGNQYGFIIKSQCDFKAIWNGGEKKEDVKVEILSNPLIKGKETGQEIFPQTVLSHFGMGTITIQNRFHFRTPPNINLMTINPPNYFISGVQHMTGVVETDNLRRDFTFNLRLTTKDLEVNVKKGDPIGCILPIPRGFVEKFELKHASDLFSNELIQNERDMVQEFAKERQGIDQKKHAKNGRRYFKGEDANNNKFIYKHKKTLKDSH